MQKLYNLNLQFSTRNFGIIWGEKNLLVQERNLIIVSCEKKILLGGKHGHTKS
jgi:hypothetical protein